MDATRRSSSKRKHLPSSPSRPLLQITTRTVHLRSDAASISDLVKHSDADDDLLVISDLCKKAKLNKESSVKDDGQPSCVPIKDLRARRVYSLQSVGGSCANSSQNVDDEQSKAGSSCRDQKMADSGFGSAPTKADTGPAGEISKRNGEIDILGECRGKDELDSIVCSIVKEYRSEKNNDLYLDEALDSRKEETESPVAGFACETQNLGYVNNGSLDEGQKSQNASDVSKLTTPPDVEICGNFKINEDERRQAEDIHVENAQLTGKAGENKEEPFCPKADFKSDYVLERKTVLRPRLQRKLFKTPGSVSYRRLLPFLMNMTKDDSGTSIMDHRRNQNEGKVIDSKKFQIPLLSQSQEAPKDQLKKDNCVVHESVELRALADNGDLSGGNEPKSKLTSHEDLHESPTQLRARDVTRDCLSVPSASQHEHNENVEISLECSSNTKADLTVDFPCDRDVANAVGNDDLKQDSEHSNTNGGNPEANDGLGICVLSQQCLNPPDADVCGEDNAPGSADHQANTIDLIVSSQPNGEDNAPGSADHQANTIDLSISSQPNGEGSCSKTTNGNNNVLNSISVLKPCMQRRLFKAPGSVSYKRLLPFIMDIAEDDSGAPKSRHRHGDERGMFSEGTQIPMLDQSQEAPTDKLKADSCHMRDNVDESNAVREDFLVDPANELSYDNQPKPTSSQVLPELPMQANAKVVQKCVSAPSITRGGSESRTTLVLNPCQQIELLKHSGSFSYKRLLPFLKNITKNNSYDRNTTLKEGLNQTTPPPIPAFDNQITPINYQNGVTVPVDHGSGNSAAQQVLPGRDDSLNNSSPEVLSSADIPESQSSHDLCKLSQLKDSNLEGSPVLPTSVVSIDSPIGTSSPIINEVNTREEDAASNSQQSSVYSEVKRNSSSNGEIPLNTDGCCQKLFQTKTSEQLTMPAFGYKKGILKRNPRGCRGLCTCLNCASFRLHAERAFEFSRNQLLDAEEVALDLMKELSRLRRMLERSTDGANDQSVLDENQVKEACRKASAAEELAKDRLNQMNDDLNIHCRITGSQQPRVRFANYVEEKVMTPGRLLRQK